MAQRQTLEDLYEAIFTATPSDNDLDEAESDLEEQGGDINALLEDWASRPTSIQSQLQNSIFETADVDPEELSDDEVTETLDEGVFFGRLVETQYEELFGRSPNGSIQNLVESDTQITELTVEDLEEDPGLANYFDGGIDFEGFQYWVNQLADGEVDPATIAPDMIGGAEEFEGEEEERIALNDQGLEFREAADETREPMDLDIPDQHPLELDSSTNDPSNPKESGTIMTPQDDGAHVEVTTQTLLNNEDWQVRGTEAEDITVSVSQDINKDGFEGDASNEVDSVTPNLSGDVESFFVRNVDDVDLFDAQDLGNLVFRDTDTTEADVFSFLDAENVNPDTDLGITNVNANEVDVEFNGTTSVHNTAIRGYEGDVELDGISSSVVGTRLQIDSLASDAGLANDIDLEADNANVLDIAGDQDLTLDADGGLALTRVDARQLEGTLDVDVSAPGLAESSTQFDAAVFGSQGDTTVRAGDKIWKEYSSTAVTGNTLTFDGGDGDNELVTNADGIEDFAPEFAWDDEDLDDAFDVSNVQTLRVEGGSGAASGLLEARVAEVADEDDDLEVADVVADSSVLDTGLFGDDLEEAVFENVNNVHVATRDNLTDITLEDTGRFNSSFNPDDPVNLEAGSALETATLDNALASTVFADGESLGRINVEGGTVGANILRLGSIEVEDDDGNTSEQSQIVRFDGTSGFNADTTLGARDGVETLSLEVEGGNGGVTAEGADLSTLDITNTSSELTGSIDNIDISGMTEDVTINQSGEGYSWVFLEGADDTNKLTVNGTEEGRQETYLGASNGLLNGDGVEIGADAAVLINGFAGAQEADGLNVTGEGELGFWSTGSEPINLFRADPGTFDVGRYTSSQEAVLESINSDAPVQVSGNMDTLELGYAREFSGDDAARIELRYRAGEADLEGEEAIQIDGFVFDEDADLSDGHVRDLEIEATEVNEPDSEDAVTPAHYIGDLDTEALGPDDNRGNTDSVDIQGAGDIYVGLGVNVQVDDNGALTDGGTEQRLAGLEDDGKISSGDGEFNAVVTNDTDASGNPDIDPHELDLDQFDDTPDSLGFGGHSAGAETELTGWDGAIRLYEGFNGTLGVTPENDDVQLDVFGDAFGDVNLSDSVNGAVTVSAAELGDAPGRLSDQDRTLTSVDLEGTSALVLDSSDLVENDNSDPRSLQVGTVENLAATGEITFAEAPFGNASTEITGTVTQNADGGDSNLTVTSEGAPEEVFGGHKIENVDMTDASGTADVTVNGEGVLFGTFGSPNTGGIDVSDADTFNGNFAADTSITTLDTRGASDTVNVDYGSLGDDQGISTIYAGNAAAGATVELDFGDFTGTNAGLGLIDSGDTDVGTGDGAESFTANFKDFAGDNSGVGDIDAQYADSVTITTGDILGDGAGIGTINAGTAVSDADVTLEFGDFGDSAGIGGIDAANAGGGDSQVTARFGDNATVDSLDVGQSDSLDLTLGGGNSFDSYSVDGTDVSVTSEGGTSAANTVGSFFGAGDHGDLTASGDTALEYLEDGPSFENGATIDLTELDANFTGGMEFDGNGDQTVQLYGDEVSGADRSFDLDENLGQASNVSFDFANMAAGQRVEIDGGSASIDNDEIEFQFEEVGFVDDDGGNLRVNGFGTDDVESGDWADVFDLAADNDSGDTKIQNADGDFELELVGVSADKLSVDNFDDVVT